VERSFLQCAEGAALSASRGISGCRTPAAARWDSRCYVLQLVGQGYGATRREAWENALSRADLPADFEHRGTTVATRWDAEHEIELS